MFCPHQGVLWKSERVSVSELSELTFIQGVPTVSAAASLIARLV